MSISSSRMNTSNYSKVALYLTSWALLHMCIVSLILLMHVFKLKLSSSSHLSLSHLGIICIEAFISVLDDETVLHADAGWANKTRLELDR